MVRTHEEIKVIPSTDVESVILGTTGMESEKKRTNEGTVSDRGIKEFASTYTSTSSTVESARTGGKGGIESKKDAIKEIAETQIPVLLKEVGDNVTSFVRSIGDALESSKHTFR